MGDLSMQEDEESTRLIVLKQNEPPAQHRAGVLWHSYPADDLGRSVVRQDKASTAAQSVFAVDDKW